MNDTLLPLAVWLQLAVGGARDRLTDLWAHRSDDDGIDEAVTKMIWLAIGIVVALAGAAFFLTTFNSAKDSVPDPVGP
ncbi:MAG TPA: hypothetical protein DCR14_06930 [Acidimicrobiaceae bacterium]|nr:hypothetical protein [Acidimicrobiaceae bacterium]